MSAIKLACDGGQPGLGCNALRRGITIDAAEVALPVN